MYKMCYTVSVKMETAGALRNAVALCATGAEKAVSNELKKLGMTVIESGFGRVRFRADIGGLYHALIGLRAADRVLLEAGFFPANDFDALFEGTLAVAWEELVPAKLGLKIAKVRCNRSQLKAETSIQSVVHKAAAQRLCTSGGLERLPATAAPAEVRVYIEKDMVSLLLDLSGDPLFKRGYRPKGGIAPLRETTAAALLLLSGWKRKYPLYDPFCGSGTILTEALIYAWDMAPGLGRNFAMNSLLIADDAIYQNVRNELRGKIQFDRVIRIAGSDEDSASVELASSNIRRALELPARQTQTEPLPTALPTVNILPMKDALPPASHRADAGENAKGREPCGFIITNPPYGKRLGDPLESRKIYAEMAALSRNFPGWKLAVITDQPGFESFFGKKADSCREISNGSIPSYFFEYERL
jgi:putative N6-adenine-specific DNA methylase